MDAADDGAARVVNIIKTTQTETGSKVSIDVPLLGSVLSNPDVRDLPVAIYSINGLYRTGKSFLLNLLLQHKNDEIFDLDFSSEFYSYLKLQNVFNFCGGLDRETKGIYILEKPIYIVTENGKCVALFLMDTQGLNDHVAASEESDVIGAVSFLLSSCFIYNVQTRIIGHDLEYIYRFAKFAKRVKEENNSNLSPFQSLIFLIRDWKMRDYPHGFEGGEHYLNWLMDVTEEQAEQHKFVRKELYESFDVIKCFLAPPPGNVVEGLETKECDLALKDIEHNFLAFFKIFFEHFFVGDNIITKKIDDIEVTGSVLYTYMVEYASVIEAGLEGNVKNFIQAEHKAEMQILFERYLRMYEEDIQKSFVPPFDWGKLALEQIIIRDRLLKKFDSEDHCVLQSCVTEARNKLLSTIDQKFEKHTSTVDRENFLKNALIEHKRSLKSILPIQTDNQINKKHNKSVEKLLTELSKQIPDDDLVKYSQKFVEEVQSIYVEMKEENDEACKNFVREIPRKIVGLVTTITSLLQVARYFV